MGENRREKWRMERVAGGNQGVMHTELEPSALWRMIVRRTLRLRLDEFPQQIVYFQQSLLSRNLPEGSRKNKHSIKGVGAWCYYPQDGVGGQQLLLRLWVTRWKTSTSYTWKLFRHQQRLSSAYHCYSFNIEPCTPYVSRDWSFTKVFLGVVD